MACSGTALLFTFFHASTMKVIKLLANLLKMRDYGHVGSQVPKRVTVPQLCKEPNYCVDSLGRPLSFLPQNGTAMPRPSGVDPSLLSATVHGRSLLLMGNTLRVRPLTPSTSPSLIPANCHIEKQSGLLSSFHTYCVLSAVHFFISPSSSFPISFYYP
jgi:hypothetical protein